MPWREVCPMDEKMRLMAAVSAEEESMTELCEDFGVSRKTAYKWRARYVEYGPAGLRERRTRLGGAVGDHPGAGRSHHRVAPRASELGTEEAAGQA